MSRLSKESAFCSVASTSQEGLEEDAPTSASNRVSRVTVPLKSLSENRPISTEKDKRPLPLFGNQPSKRLRGELTDHEVSPGSVGFLPSSVEHGQSSSSVTSQSHKGHDYQRRQNQSSSDHGRPPLPVGYNQLSFATVTQPSMQMHQTSHTQKLLGQMFKNLQQMQCDTGNVCSKDALSAKLERIASDKGFVISDNEGSGNCMFYALSEQLYLVKGITISHEELRQFIVQYLRKNPKLPDGTDLFNFINGYRSWADYLTDMEQDGTWGDHMILYAVANCFETYIHVISSQSDHHDLTISPHCHVISTNPLVLGHVHEVHYLSLKPKQEDDNAQGGSVAEDESVQTGHDADKVVLNKEATAGSSDHGRPPLSVGYNQLSFTTVTQPSTQTHQTSHTQIAFKEGKPSDRELDELAGKIGAKWETLGIHLDIGQDVLKGIDANAQDKPYQLLLRWRNTTPSATPYGHLYHALCHDRVGLNNLAKEFCCFPGQLPSSVEYNQLPSAVVSQNNEGYNNSRSHTQSFSGHDRQPSSVGYNQLPLVRGAHSYRGPSGYGWPPLTMEYNRTSYPATTQTFGERAAYQGMHTQKDESVQTGHDAGSLESRPISMEKDKRLLPIFDNQPSKRLRGELTDNEGSSERGISATSPKRHRLSMDNDTGHGLSVFLRILKAEYNKRSLLKPLLWENTFRLPLQDVYTRLSIVSRKETNFQLDSDEVNMYDISKTLNKGEGAMVLVEGSPGIGKTTFCLKLSYDWTNNTIPNNFSFPVFKLLLLLKCRDIDGDIMEAISEQLLPEDMDEKFRKGIIDYIKDIHNQEKILIILDGLDELPKTAETHVDKLLYRRILPFCYVLATSSQERGIVVRQKVDFDVLLQIEGFTKQDAFDYIRKYFRHFGPEHSTKGERLIQAIQENTFLHALPSNPLNLLLLCVVFEDYQGELPSFCTELYQIIVRCLLRRYCAKHDLETPADDQALEKQFEDSLLVLGELAWRCLLEDRFSFREEELAKFERKIKDLAARKLGLVFKEASMKRINPQHEYHFFHKNFQEYLAATYLAHKLLKVEVNVFSEFNLDFHEHITTRYRQVFLFVSGILGDDASLLFGSIGEMLITEHWEWFRCSEGELTFFNESCYESGSPRLMATVLCSFIPLPETSLDTDCYDAWSALRSFSETRMDELRSGGVIPSYVLARGADAVAAFRRALEFGSIFDKRVKVLLIGQDRVGKTSLGKSLKGEPFDENEPSTDGVQMSLLMRNVDGRPWSDSVLPHNTTVFDHKCALIISEKLRQQTIEESSGKGVEKQTGESMKQVPENSKQEKSEADETGISSHKNEEGKDLGNVHEQEKGESNVVGHTASPVDGNHRGKRQEELNNPSFDYTISDQMSLLIEENLTSEKSIEDEGVWTVIWDFAGQTVYRAIHPLFMSPDAVYVLVSDLTKKLSETSCCHVKESNHPEAKAAGLDSEDSNLDHIMRWIDSVHSLKQSESCSSSLCKSFPPVILVGTHVDKLEGNPEEEKMSMLEELSPVLTKDFTDHITTHSFAIDNTKAGSSSYQEDSEVVALRKHIIDLATEMPHVKKKIPLQWLYVENEVYKRSSQGKKYVTKQTFKDQIVKPFCQIDREDDIEELLHFLYARGTIVYHDCTNSEDSVVVLDPQWLKEVLFQIITAKPNKVGLLKYYQKLQEKGILAEELIDEACKKLELERIKELLIAIMQAFNLIFKWKEEDGKFWYYVPCMLTTTTEDLSEPNTANPGKEVKDRRTTCGLAPIYLTFNTKYVPSGLFCRLVVLFWEWASSRCSSEQPELFANAAKFFIGPVNCIRFVCFKRVIKLRVWGQDYSHPVENQPTICKEILRCLEDYLKKLRKECRWLYSMSWDLCAQCNYKCQEHSLCHWHKIQGCGHDDCGHYIPLQAEPLCCSKASGDCTLLPQDVFEPWIQALNEIKPRKKTVLSKITPASSSTGKRKEPSFPSTGKRKEPSFPVDAYPSKRRREELNDCHQVLSKITPASSSTGKRKEPSFPSTGKRKEPSFPVDAYPSKRRREELNDCHQVKQHVPRDEELEFLAREIPDCWIVLGRRLEVEEAQLKAFQKQNDTVSEGAYEMLQHWKKRDASCATYQVLYNALCHKLVNRRDLAEKYCC